MWLDFQPQWFSFPSLCLLLLLFKAISPSGKETFFHLFRKHSLTYWTNIAGTMSFQGLSDDH